MLMRIEQYPMVTVNVLYALWRENDESSAWMNRLRTILGDKKRCEAILEGGTPTEGELHEICIELGLEEDAVQVALLPEPKEIATQNIRYLISLLEMKQKELATALHINESTISRWKGGEQLPGRQHQRTILRFFGLPQEWDLQEVPIFLSLRPLDTYGRKAWLKRRIDEIAPDNLAQLFPALSKLLGSDETD